METEQSIEVRVQDGDVWLTQKAMAELFEVQKAAISKHLKNIFEQGELQRNSVVSTMETTAADYSADRPITKNFFATVQNGRFRTVNGKERTLCLI